MIEGRVYKRFIPTFQHAPGRAQDVTVTNGSLSKLQRALEADSEQSGCTHYIVLNEGDGNFVAWRDGQDWE